MRHGLPGQEDRLLHIHGGGGGGRANTGGVAWLTSRRRESCFERLLIVRHLD